MNLHDKTSNRSYRLRLLLEVILVVFLCCFPLFYRLDTLAIRQWDEARNAVSALQMLQNKQYVVRFFNGEPDFFDVKPPLLIWLQALSIKLLGANELAIRMPSAIAALLTVMFLIWYFHKYHNNRFAGYLASLILVTSQGYIDRHMARTGDHDALLVLFTTMSIFLFYEFLRGKRTNNRLMALIASLLVASVYTKSVAVFMIIPGLLVSAIYFGQQRRIFMNKWFYACLGLFILLCGSYYALRETMQPGYLKAVWTGELFPRYLNTNKAFFDESILYYAQNLLLSRFGYWMVFLLPALVVLPWLHRKEKRNLPIYLLINAILFLLVISAGSNNLWYDGPLFPLLAALTALFLCRIPVFLPLFIKKIRLTGSFTMAIVLVTIFIYPGMTIMKKVSRTNEFFWDEEIYSMCYVLRDLQNIPELSDKVFSIAFDGYSGHLLFYTTALAYYGGPKIEIKPTAALQTGEYVLVSQQSIINGIGSKCSYSLIFQKHHTKLLRITGLLKSSRQ